MATEKARCSSPKFPVREEMLAEGFSDSGPVVHFSKLELVHFDLAENTFDELQRSLVQNASFTLCRDPRQAGAPFRWLVQACCTMVTVVHPLSAVKTQLASLCWPTMEGMTEVLKKVQITVY